MDIRNDESRLPEQRELFREFGIDDPNEVFAVALISGRPELLTQFVPQTFQRPEVLLARHLQESISDYANVPQPARTERNRRLHEACLKNPRPTASPAAVEKAGEMLGQLGFEKIFSGKLTPREALIVQTKLMTDIATGGIPRIEYGAVAKPEEGHELDFVTVPTYGIPVDQLMAMTIRLAYEAQAAGEETEDLLEILRALKDDIWIGHLLTSIRLLSLAGLRYVAEGNGREFLLAVRVEFSRWMSVALERFGTENVPRLAELGKVAKEADRIFQDVERVLLAHERGGSGGGGAQ